MSCSSSVGDNHIGLLSSVTRLFARIMRVFSDEKDVAERLLQTTLHGSESDSSIPRGGLLVRSDDDAFRDEGDSTALRFDLVLISIAKSL